MSLHTKFGRFQVAEPPHMLASLHVRRKGTLKEVDWEPKVGVLDQEDLLKQGIRCSEFIPGAGDPDALGSCTANATTSALSNLLSEAEFLKTTGASSYDDTVGAEKFAIGFYHRCSDQTGDPGQEWPPTDCGSSGPYIVQELQHEGLAAGAQIAHGGDNLISLMQSGGVLMGSPWLSAWMQPGPDAFIDGDGGDSTLERQIQEGVAGGHETFLSAVEKVTTFADGSVDPRNTIIRARNSWTKNWGDNGSYRVHLSTLVALGGYIDFRQLQAVND